MISFSEIDLTTIAAYMETDYCTFGSAPFVMHIGVASESLLMLYKLYGVECCAFITAFNPFSQNEEDETNASRQDNLTKELERRSLAFLEGEGRNPSGGWPVEPSYLVLGLSLEASKILGRKYDQNAFVWCGADAIPELILLR